MKTNYEMSHFPQEVIYYKMYNHFNTSFSGGKITVINVHIVECIRISEMLEFFFLSINQGNNSMLSIWYQINRKLCQWNIYKDTDKTDPKEYLNFEKLKTM